MGWRTILETEHRLMLEVADAANKRCEHIAATGVVRADFVTDILGFFCFFCDGLHDPKEDGLLFARCRKRGMTNDDEPLEQMPGEHERPTGRLDGSQIRHFRGRAAGATSPLCGISRSEAAYLPRAASLLAVADVAEGVASLVAALDTAVAVGEDARRWMDRCQRRRRTAIRRSATRYWPAWPSAR